MSSTPKQPTASNSTAGNLLSILQSANGWVTLGMEVGGVVIPLVKALIKKIEQTTGAGGSVDYQILLTADQATLESVTQISLADLAAINSELTRLGLPTLVVPPAAS
jgi:hypothetical protein